MLWILTLKIMHKIRIIKNYNDKESNTVEQSETVDNATNKRWGNGKVRISNITTFSTDMKKKSVFSTGDSIILKIEYKCT
jgi:hypothetical protein